MTTMRLRNYLEKEAAGYVDGLGGGAADPVGPDELERLHAHARGLSGAARLAGDDRVQRAASAIQRALRSASLGSVPDDLAERFSRSVEELRILLKAEESEDRLDAIADTIVARWTEPDSLPVTDTEEEPDTETLAGFVEREADSIADTMDHGLAAFAESPSSREWLGAILRRQRALLGSVRLDDVPIVAEALRAVEDLSELIVRLDVPVKSEWLDVFRSARDVLRSSSESLRDGQEPQQTPALSRLRTLREELVDRYGDRAPARTPETGAEQEIETPVTVEQQDEDPRQRAAALKVRIASALADDPGTRDALDELYAILLSALP